MSVNELILAAYNERMQDFYDIFEKEIGKRATPLIDQLKTRILVDAGFELQESKKPEVLMDDDADSSSENVTDEKEKEHKDKQDELADEEDVEQICSRHCDKQCESN